jgi:5'-methylthioadenosine phosphorylase
MSVDRVIGVIGGSGLYEISGLTSVERVRLDTPFGSPSDEYVVGRLGEVKMVFLPRHGRGHRILPHEINFRANVHGMKQLGVEWLISVSAVGSMREEIRPGDLVIVDQFVDLTRRRASSFFGEGAAGHVSMADPICPDLAAHLLQGAKEIGARVHAGGTYLVIDGPQFSSRAESRIYRQWGVDVIGMTNMPEAKLAREAGICYASIALSTDYDCWHEAEEDVTVSQVMAVMRENVAKAREVVRVAAGRIAPPRTCGCAGASTHALMTDPSLVPQEVRARLALILGKTP